MKKIEWESKKQTFFIACHFIIWPYGLGNVLAYFLTSDKHFSYHDDYLTTNSCRPDFSFVYSKNNLECKVSEELLRSFFVFIVIYFALALCSLIVFLAIFRLANKFDRSRKLRSVPAVSNVLCQTMFTKGLSYDLRKYVFRFSLTSIVYIFYSLPICALQIYLILEGPRLNGVSVAYRILNIMTPSSIAFINITAYGFSSTSFQKEMKKKLKLKERHSPSSKLFINVTYRKESGDDEETAYLL